MADVKDVAWEIKSQLDAHEALGTSHSYGAIVLRKALSVIEEQQEEIARLKAQKEKWLRNIADKQLAVSPTGWETEEGLAKRTGEWNGLQMAWEILTKE